MCKEKEQNKLKTLFCSVKINYITIVNIRIVCITQDKINKTEK